MPGRVLLIAEDADFARLRAESDLPAQWLSDAGPRTAISQSGQPAPLVLRCRPDLLLPPEDAPPGERLDRRDRAELIGSFLDATACYLAVVGEQDAGPEDAGCDRKESPIRQSLACHLQWYERFRQETKALLQGRDAHLRHVLVLVCCRDPPADAFSAFQRLVAGCDREQLFDVAYVMLEELEPGSTPETGEQTPLLFYAEHVWPLAVGDLFLRLLQDDPQGRGGRTTAYAWRCYPLAPKIPAAEQRRIAEDQLGRLCRELTSGEPEKEWWDPARFTQFEPRATGVEGRALRPRELGAPQEARTWLEYSPSERLEDTRSAGRWQEGLIAAGDALGRQLSALALDEDPLPVQEAEKVWQAAHRDPRVVSRALAHPAVHGPAPAGQFPAMKSRWEQLLAANRRRARLVEEAGGCAKHLEAAQAGYVDWLARVGVAAAVTLCVGYVSMVLFSGLVGAFYAACIAVAGGAGALVAAFYSLDREGAAGRRARDAFEQQLGEIDRAMLDRHEACQEAVRCADVFGQEVRAGAAAGRLRRLLRRVQCMFDRELRLPVGVEGEGVAATVAADGVAPQGDETAEEVRARRQRTRYRLATRLGQPVADDRLDAIAREAELESFVHQQAAMFRDELWLTLCQEQDPACAGNLPAQELVPLLRRFRKEFLKALVSKVRRLVIQRLGDEDLQEWGRTLRRIVELQPYYELLSCRMESHQTADPLHRPLPKCYLRRGFDCGRLKLELAGSHVQEEPHASDLLDELPLLGFLFQEMPVQFEVAEGKVRVAATYRDQESPADPAAPPPALAPRPAREGPDPQATEPAEPESKPKRRRPRNPR